MATSFSDLPVSVLSILFGKLDPSDRAGNVDCVARVSSTFAEAAAAATTRTIELQGYSRTSTLDQWLSNRGSGVTSIKLTYPMGVITSLPCPELATLDLQNCSMDLRPGSRLLQDLCAAKNLEHLYLNGVMFHGEPDLAALLPALPKLRILLLANVTIVSTATGVEHNHASAPSLWSAGDASNPRCRNLTDKGMQLLCQLTQLQSLRLNNMQGITAEGLAGLDSLPTLKRLALTGLGCNISWSAVPAISQLTALTHLKLGWKPALHSNGPAVPLQPQFDPALLVEMTQLKAVELSCANPIGGAAGAAELLSRLSRLGKLEVLKLEYVACLDLCPPAAFAALTASSALRSLTWAHCGYMPGLWQHMLPAQLRLSQLTELDMTDTDPWQADDLDRLVSSCSALQELSLWCADGLNLTALLHLTQLTRLGVRGVTSRTTSASLAQLCSLQKLNIVMPCRLTDRVLASWTALAQLTHLTLESFDGLSTTMTQQLIQLEQQRCSKHRIPPFRADAALVTLVNMLLSCCEHSAAQEAVAAQAAAAQAAEQEAAAQEAAAQAAAVQTVLVQAAAVQAVAVQVAAALAALAQVAIVHAAAAQAAAVQAAAAAAQQAAAARAAAQEAAARQAAARQAAARQALLVQAAAARATAVRIAAALVALMHAAAVHAAAAQAAATNAAAARAAAVNAAAVRAAAARAAAVNAAAANAAAVRAAAVNAAAARSGSCKCSSFAGSSREGGIVDGINNAGATATPPAAT